MKFFFTTLFLALAILQANAQVSWTTPVTVYNGSGSNLHPRVSLNRSGNPVILWGKTDTRAYFSRWTGTAFSSPTTVSGSLRVFAQSWAGPDMATHGDTIYVSMKVTPENVAGNYTYLSHSYDGGMTFSTPVRIDNIDTSMSRFPIVTTTSNGNPLVAFMKFNSILGDAHYVVCRSTDFGATFSGDVLASGAAGTVCDCCPATIISAGSNAIMLFRNNLTNIRDIWAGVSPDGGMTFPGHMAVDNTNWLITSCPATGPDGFVIGDSIYSTFMSTGTGTALAYLSKSSISGLSSTSTTAITGTFAGLNSQNYPRIANYGNAATAVWKQNTTSGTTIEYAFTNNIANGFATHTTVATGSGLMNADVAMANGVIHIVWEDDNTSNIMYMKGAYTPATTSIPMVSKELIEVYPNPTTESFSFNINSIGNISSCYITNNIGRNFELHPIVKDGKGTISVTGIAKGAYYFVINDEVGRTFYSKLIVE